MALDMNRLGIIDIGSNSIKSLVVRTEADGRVVSESEGRSPTRIGTGLSDQPPQIRMSDTAAAAEAISELMAHASHHRAQAASHSGDTGAGAGHAIPFHLYATSAIREASNRERVVQELSARCAAPLTVLSGEEEATLIGWAARSMPELAAIEELLIADLGGGSLELVHLQAGKIRQLCSLHLGAVRLNTEYFHGGSEPIRPQWQQALGQHVDELFTASGFDFEAARGAVFVGSGGALSALHHMRCFAPGEGRMGSIPLLPVANMQSLYEQACAVDVRQRIITQGFPKNRADIMPAAMLVLLNLAGRCGARDYAYCSHNLRFGLAAQTIYNERSGQPWQPHEPIPAITIHAAENA